MSYQSSNLQQFFPPNVQLIAKNFSENGCLISEK